MDVEAQRYRYQYPGVWIEQQVGAEHTGDGATRTDHGDRRLGVGQGLSKGGSNAADKVKHDKTAMAHSVLDVVTKYPQVKHVAGQVHEASV